MSRIESWSLLVIGLAVAFSLSWLLARILVPADADGAAD